MARGIAVDSLDDRSGGVVRASSQPVSALSLPGATGMATTAGGGANSVPSRPTAQGLAHRVGDSEHSKLARLFRRRPPDAPRRIPAVPRFT
jgi:hypothetical protein